MLHKVLILALVMLLASCGGSSSPPPASPPPALPTISAVVLSGGHTPDPKIGPDLDTNYYIGPSGATLTAAASSPVGLTSVQLLVDNLYVATALDTANISFSNITFNLADGTHTFTVRAFDNAGQSSDKSITAIVDKTSPAGTIVSPANGSVITGGTAFVQSNIVDIHMYTVELLVDDKPYSYVPAYNSGPAGSITTGNYPAGAHKLTMICTDKALNQLNVSVNVSW